MNNEESHEELAIFLLLLLLKFIFPGPIPIPKKPKPEEPLPTEPEPTPEPGPIVGPTPEPTPGPVVGPTPTPAPEPTPDIPIYQPEPIPEPYPDIPTQEPLPEPLPDIPPYTGPGVPIEEPYPDIPPIEGVPIVDQPQPITVQPGTGTIPAITPEQIGELVSVYQMAGVGAALTGALAMGFIWNPALLGLITAAAGTIGGSPAGAGFEPPPFEPIYDPGQMVDDPRYPGVGGR